MKKRTAILLLSVLGLLTISAISVAHFFFTTFKVMELDMHASVGDRLGINADNDKLWFGMVKGSSINTRRLHLKNDLNQPILVTFVKLGPIAEYVTLPSPKIQLGPKEEMDMGISVQFPIGMPYGNYTGTLKVLFKKNLF
ncbi:hypothetical protein HY501_02940 [Candidatus Woesearchaeota archaeon]|nr:hypothetical protein [Candidatus Woesearchaeota archaeon]